MKTREEIQSASSEEKRAWLLERQNARRWYYQNLARYGDMAKAVDATAAMMDLTGEEVCEIAGVSMEEVTR